MSEKWVLRFPTDTFRGDSAEEVLRQLAKTQWDAEGRSKIKRALAWRAAAVSGEMLNEHDDDETFLRAFAQTGLAVLEVTQDE